MKKEKLYKFDTTIKSMKNTLVGIDGKPITPAIKHLPKNPDDKKLLCIYVPASWPFVFRKFFTSFLKIIHPINIIKLREFGIVNYFTLVEPKFPLCKNRNEAVMKAKKFNADYIMFLDADMQHPPDIVYKLMKHQLPVVSGIYYHQSPPHFPVIYKHKEGIQYTHYCDYPKDVIFPVDLVGMGCLLLDTRVLENIKLPYFGYRTNAKTGIVEGTEEVIFCEKIKEQGYDIMIDPTIQCSHLALEDVTHTSFDMYMEEYKTGLELISKFGDGTDGI
jgi:glycosyltransferase involved in cell wall biosynthesis